jgi:uncharacterized protein (DUF924 family)
MRDQCRQGINHLKSETNQIPKIADFWLGPALSNPETAFARRDWWYAGGTTADKEIRARFGALVESACRRDLPGWQDTPDGAFALILLLDQFTRNIYRGTPDAYAGDQYALQVVQQTIDRALDQVLHPVSRIWLYHPFHHAEDINLQDRGLGLLNQMLETEPSEWHPYIQRSIKGWTRHRDIVARFGRFPHRNRVLGRTSSAEEQAFLAADGESFGQGKK